MRLAQALGSTGALRGAHEPPTKKAFMGKGIGTSCVGMGQNWVAPNQGTNCAQGSCNHATGVMIGYDLDMIGVFPASVERRWQPMATDGNRWQLPGRIAAW